MVPRPILGTEAEETPPKKVYFCHVYYSESTHGGHANFRFKTQPHQKKMRIQVILYSKFKVILTNNFLAGKTTFFIAFTFLRLWFFFFFFLSNTEIST